MGGTVCIIADDQDMRQVLSHIVRSVGLTAALYDSAQSFLRRTGDRPTGCMVVDVPLRGTQGAALLQKLAEGSNECPVFLIGDAMSHVSAVAARRCAAVLIEKPFDARLLAQGIRTAINADR